MFILQQSFCQYYHEVKKASKGLQNSINLAWKYTCLHIYSFDYSHGGISFPFYINSLQRSGLGKLKIHFVKKKYFFYVSLSRVYVSSIAILLSLFLMLILHLMWIFSYKFTVRKFFMMLKQEMNDVFVSTSFSGRICIGIFFFFFLQSKRIFVTHRKENR